jgi:hypothetical protein
MSSLLYRINSVWSHGVAGVPMGTHLGLLHLLGMLLSGRLLQSRGAVIPGLADLGLAAEAVRRCWAGLAYGKPSSCCGPGNNSSSRKRAFKHTARVAIARGLVTWSSACGFSTARPSTTRPPRARHYRPSRGASRRG